MLNITPVAVCYKRGKKFYWSIKSKGYETEKEALDAVPNIKKVLVSREKNTVYNGDLEKTKGVKNNGGK